MIIYGNRRGLFWDPKTHGVFYRTLWKIQTLIPAIKVIRIYINNHILNVLKYIFDNQLIIKLQSDFLNE